MSERQSGRTTKLLAAAPANSVFIVHNAAMRNYIKQWLAETGREKDNIEVISLAQADNYLRGRRIPVVLDHTLHDRDCKDHISRRDLDMLKMHLDYTIPMIVWYQDGIRTAWRQR